MNKYSQEKRLNDDNNCSLAFIVQPPVTRFTLYINISLKLQIPALVSYLALEGKHFSLLILLTGHQCYFY